MDQICIKRTFLVEKDKSVNHHWIMHFLISLGTKFWLKLKILIFWTKFTQIGHSWSKKAKLNITTEFYIFTILNFGTKFAQKRYFRSKTKKSEHHRCILHIWISLGTKFQLKLAILIFWTKPKKCFQLEAKKVSITIAFCIFEILWAPIFTSHNDKFWDQICPTRVFSVKNEKSEHNIEFYIFAILNFGTKFARKRYFRSKTKKVNIAVVFRLFELV